MGRTYRPPTTLAYAGDARPSHPVRSGHRVVVMARQPTPPPPLVAAMAAPAARALHGTAARSAVLASYRSLLRAVAVTFAGDTLALAHMRRSARSAFLAPDALPVPPAAAPAPAPAGGARASGVPAPLEGEALAAALAAAEEATAFVLTGVAQARKGDAGRYGESVREGGGGGGGGSLECACMHARAFWRVRSAATGRPPRRQRHGARHPGERARGRCEALQRGPRAARMRGLQLPVTRAVTRAGRGGGVEGAMRRLGGGGRG
jgi:hypothetical protein